MMYFYKDHELDKDLLNEISALIHEARKDAFFDLADLLKNIDDVQAKFSKKDYQYRTLLLVNDLLIEHERYAERQDFARAHLIGADSISKVLALSDQLHGNILSWRDFINSGARLTELGANNIESLKKILDRKFNTHLGIGFEFLKNSIIKEFRAYEKGVNAESLETLQEYYRKKERFDEVKKDYLESSVRFSRKWSSYHLYLGAAAAKFQVPSIRPMVELTLSEIIGNIFEDAENSWRKKNGIQLIGEGVPKS